MLSRVSSSLLLKSVIAAMGGALVIVLGLSSWDAWRSVRVADRLAMVAEVSGLTFRAMHNLRVIRSFTLRGLNGIDTIAPAQEKMLNSFNKVATDALREALLVLPRIAFKDHASMPADLERSLSRLVSLSNEASQEFLKPKHQRRPGLATEFGAMTTDFLALLDRLNGLLAAESKNKDAFVDQMMMLKDATWIARNASGDISVTVSEGIASMRLSAEAQRQIAVLVGQIQAAWEMLARAQMGSPPPEAVTAAIGKAHEAVLGQDMAAKRDQVVTKLAAATPPGISPAEWSGFTVPRLNTLTNAGEAALDAAAAHAGRQVALAQRNLAIQGGLLALALCLAVGGILAVSRRVVAPLQRIQDGMMKVAAGDLAAAVPYLDRRDEIGDLAQALAVFKQNAIDKARIEDEEHARQERAGRRQQAVEGHIATFEGQIGEALAAFTAAAKAMTAMSHTLFAASEETNAQARGAAQSSTEASANVQTVAAASEELAASIGEISRQVAHSADIAQRAVRETEATDATVQGLTEAAEQIGRIVKLITEIANQTNLLALNATIEAARAGDAGRGFAVVAAEVKALASQTAKATEDISAQVAAIQEVARDAVAAMRRVGGTIGEVNEVATTIASAVEEQGAATHEITRNTQEAARRTESASASIAGVTAGAGATDRAAGAVNKNADVLGYESDNLRRCVDQFLTNIRAA